MGKVLSKQLQRPEAKALIDKVYTRLAADGDRRLDKDQLYVGVLLFFNEINKNFPGPHNDPPTREEVEEMLQRFDTNNNGVLDRHEFEDFLQMFTEKVAVTVSRNVLVLCLVAPALAYISKKVTSPIPLVGQAVRHIPGTVYGTVVFAALAHMNNQKV
eukprot:SM000048S16607  [mRNA]  locus=s48:685197:685959:- [translate_table: standard]